MFLQKLSYLDLVIFVIYLAISNCIIYIIDHILTICSVGIHYNEYNNIAIM